MSSRYQGKPCIHGHGTERYISGPCCECSRLSARKYVGENRVAHRRRYAKYRTRHLEKCRERGRAAQRKRQGLPEPTRLMPALCECCNTRPASHLDHCHATKEFRGWLCNSCNRGIGLLGDSSTGLSKALAYINRGNDE